MDRAGKAAEEAMARIRPTIADEHYLTGDDVCERLHISRRTLQTLRDENMVSYTTIGGKILYPESGLYEVLKKNYRDFPPAYRLKGYSFWSVLDGQFVNMAYLLAKLVSIFAHFRIDKFGIYLCGKDGVVP